MPSTMPSASYVLYIDDRQHPVPLAECYHATAARSLASTPPTRFPGSALAAVESYYCAQCWRAPEAGVCDQCCLCPWCQSVVTVDGAMVGEAEGNAAETVDVTFFYQCENCDWSSEKYCPHLSVTLSVVSNGTSWETLRATATEQLQARRRDRSSRSDAACTSLRDAWQQYYNSHHERRISESADRRSAPRNEEPWSWPQLEAQLQDRRGLADATAAATKDSRTSPSRTTIQDLLLQSQQQQPDPKSDVDTPEAEDEFHDLSFLSYQWQFLVADPEPRTWYPLARPLEIRYSYRSKAEVLWHHRPGILLKPKLHPLDGDSSSSSSSASYGQWFRKDSSAADVLPNVHILRQQRRHEDEVLHFLVQVSNPTLGALRCRLVASAYAGEEDYWNDDDDDDDKNTLLRHVLVDPWGGTVLDAIPIVPTVAETDTAPMVELGPAADALLESGGRVGPVPDAVRDWDATSASSLHCLGHEGATAWWHVTMDRRSEPSATGAAYGCPVALEIALGDGSWESSLIPPVSAEGDAVTFHLLLVGTA